ncbi:MAG: XdhC family protein [Kangiellaceae bacterium]|nr:XdhC family protein [Kangiellaceae bacterium]
MRSLFHSLSKIDKKKNYIVAIVTDTKGSTYRKLGAMMLIDQYLNYWGLLSGGCLEGDIIEHCKNIFKNKCDKKAHYNMRDETDMLWGMGLGCDGEITILLKFLPAAENHFGFFDNLQKIDSGMDAVLHLECDANNDVNEITFSFNKTSLSQQSEINIPIKAPHQLLICGASPDVSPVTAMANQIGWKTTIIDHRADYAERVKFPHADQVIHLKRSRWKSFSLDDFDSAIIMSHQFERDTVYLRRLLSSPISYIGLLGPTKRRDKLLQECDSTFSEQEGRVFGPIGLDIGASSPETIALAIISEIQAVKNGKIANKKIAFCYQDENR